MFDLQNTIVDLVFADWHSLPDKLKKLGIRFELFEDGQSLFICNGKIRAGLADGNDPITKATMFGFALVGERWAAQFPDLLKVVDSEWKRRRKGGSK
ncbi:MAG: hypothetical protein ACRCZS_23805 [Chroococcidiopsis sp.]